MSKVEDYITLPMSDWKEYQQRRKELATSHEKRRQELRRVKKELHKAKMVNECWEEAWKLTFRYAEQNMSNGKQMLDLLNGMYTAVLRKVLQKSKEEE